MEKEYIIKKNEDIATLVGKKKRLFSDNYIVYYYKHERFKLAVSVSKKLGKANIRNYEKRVVKEILRPLVKQMPSYQMLIVVREKALESEFLAKKEDLLGLIKKIR